MSNGSDNNAAPQKEPLKLEHLISLLEHPRSLFIYHAGQRFSTINYFFVAFAIFAAAFVSTFTKDFQDASQLHLLRFGLAIMALLITVIFWMLDKRNQELVHVDELCQHEIEKLIQAKYDDIKNVQLVSGWSKHKQHGWLSDVVPSQERKHGWQWIGQYSFIMPMMYSIFLLVSFLIAIWQGLPLIPKCLAFGG